MTTETTTSTTKTTLNWSEWERSHGRRTGRRLPEGLWLLRTETGQVLELNCKGSELLSRLRSLGQRGEVTVLS